MISFVLGLAAASPPIVFYDVLPTTLNPLHATGSDDERAQALIFDRLFENHPYN